MNQNERIRRWMDGELDPGEVEALRVEALRKPQLAKAMAEANQVRQAVALLKCEVPRPSDPLVERAVRHAVRRRIEAEANASWWQWLWQPRVFRLRSSPMSLTLTAAVLSVGLIGVTTLGMTRWRSHVAMVPSRVAEVLREAEMVGESEVAKEADVSVPVRFVLPADGASSVAVAGDFNAWQPEDLFLKEDGDGVFVATLRLRPGTYAYAFVVDGERWVADPFATNFQDDGFGTRNAVLRID